MLLFGLKQGSLRIEDGEKIRHAVIVAAAGERERFAGVIGLRPQPAGEVLFEAIR